MITKLQVKNFRSLADVTIDLDALNVFVGQNGSGKSSIVDAVRFVSDALRLGLKTAITKRSGMSALRRWSSKGRPYDVEIGVIFQEAGFEGEYYFVLGSERKGEYRVKTEICSGRFADDSSGQPDQYRLHEGKWVRPPAFSAPTIQADTLFLPLLAGMSPYHVIYDYLTQMGFYTIFPKLLRDHRKPANPYPLEEDASNLASVVDNLPEETQSRLKRALQFVIPDVDAYQVRQAGSRLMIKLHHVLKTSENGSTEGKERSPWFELSQESDGILRMLALLVALHQDPPQSLIALEEPELNVHPGVMPRLWEEINTASGRRQVVLTTHSPDLLDLCAAEQLRIVEKINGVTLGGPIDKAQKQIICEKLFSPGQLFQAQGLLRAVEAADATQ